MPCQLIAADIDGTLLTSDRRLTDETVRAISEAREAGVLFTLSTGRPLQGIRDFRHLLSPDVPVITYNGSMVLTADTCRILFSAGLSPKAARAVFAAGKARGFTVVAWGQNHLYCREINDEVLDYRKLTRETPLAVPDEAAFAAIADAGVTKMIWIGDAPLLADCMASLGDSLGDGVRFTTSNPRYLEFMNPAVSKSAALGSAAEFLGIPRERVAAVGDGLNDLDMIRWAGYGVAMGNGAPAVREAARFVTLTNDEDGLAAAIRRLLREEW